MKIYLDPGHGGSDPGATGYGLKEKDLTLAIALKVRDMLLDEYEGVEVKMSRTKDVYVSLVDRTAAANAWDADYLCSIHINAGGGVGFEIHTYDDDYKGKDRTNRIAEVIHNTIQEETDFLDRGCKESNFHMVRESNMSASLTENGFIDNVEDAHKLKQDSFLDKIARGHVKGMQKALNLKAKPKAHIASHKPPKPSDDKPWFLTTGNFGSYEEMMEGIKKMEGHPVFKRWIKHRKLDELIDPDRYVIQTGSVIGRNVAEYYADIIHQVFGWTTYIQEAK